MSNQPLISDDAVDRLCDVIEGIAQALNGDPAVSDGSVAFGLVSIAGAIDGLTEAVNDHTGGTLSAAGLLTAELRAHRGM